MKTKPTPAGHERIYLQPECCAGDEGRVWCEDDVFTGECDEDAKPTEYVRADLYEHLRAEIDFLQTKVREREAAFELVEKINAELQADGERLRAVYRAAEKLVSAMNHPHPPSTESQGAI